MYRYLIMTWRFFFRMFCSFNQRTAWIIPLHTPRAHIHRQTVNASGATFLFFLVTVGYVYLFYIPYTYIYIFVIYFVYIFSNAFASILSERNNARSQPAVRMLCRYVNFSRSCSYTCKGVKHQQQLSVFGEMSCLGDVC